MRESCFSGELASSTNPYESGQGDPAFFAVDNQSPDLRECIHAI